ncbi:hypothetical protein DACRYDRAFT_82342 [Dacryopinax primogenitus]|uniref:RNase III domain-containing protein n=1 Tax=Dacryopinax primogenitus (strain DJM 731) TaxID=1858805 RepID=M5G096_DACPD|nr:uncharacterized protein DACRYDRAFT_82342 [Dacryopinax primogenitus]EJT99241.1 hypothetical protein DACRYDRAFT_82342 [Dacryopinax primogenitus]
MNGQRLAAGVRGTLNAPRQAQIVPRCIARPACNYSSSSLLISSLNDLNSPRLARHHPPRIPRARVVRSQSTDASSHRAPSSPFPSPYDEQSPPPATNYVLDDYVSRSLNANPGATARRHRTRSDRPPVAHADPFHKRSLHPIAPCTNAEVVEYFRQLLDPLEFSEQFAARLVTHTSWGGGMEGHNGRFIFLGRRFLRANMFMFLQSAEVHAPESKFVVPPWSEEIEAASQKMLETHILGRDIGSAWELERVMRWVPIMPDSTDRERIFVSSGLYKVRGATVEAVMGGILHQYGGLVAHRAFQTRIVPHLWQHLPLSYQRTAEELAERMGGPKAMLLIPPVTPSVSSGEPIEPQVEKEEKQRPPLFPDDARTVKEARGEMQRSKPAEAVKPAPSHNKMLLMI